jgi:acetyltransferase-like isoleucine patch superfamily enzyme
MKKLGFLQRLSLKLLTKILDNTEISQTHPINALLQTRISDGRSLAPAFTHPQISVGEYTYGLRRDCFFPYHPEDRVLLGKFCSIAEGVRFVFGEHRLDSISTFPFRALCGEGLPHADALSKGNITIGHDVWIGTHALILSGVTIGNGAVIAAGAVVSRDVPPYAVVGGVPARLIRMRLDPHQITALENIAWWNWPLEKIQENIELFYDAPEKFIQAHDLKR